MMLDQHQDWEAFKAALVREGTKLGANTAEVEAAISRSLDAVHNPPDASAAYVEEAIARFTRENGVLPHAYEAAARVALAQAYNAGAASVE